MQFYCVCARVHLCIMEAFGRRLKLIRERNDISKSALSEALGVDESTIHRYEKNKMIPKIDVIIGLTQFFKCSADVVIGLKEDDETYLSEISRNCAGMITSLELEDQLLVEQYIFGFCNANQIFRRRFINT